MAGDGTMTAPAPAGAGRTLRAVLARVHMQLVLFTVALATASLLVSGVIVIRNHARRNLELTANAIGYAIEPAVLLGDPSAVEARMIAVGAGRGVERIEVRNGQGQVQAQWHRPQSGARALVEGQLNSLLWSRPSTARIDHGGTVLADVRVYGSSANVLRYAMVCAIIALSCLGLAIVALQLLAGQLQREMIAPIARVSRVARAARLDPAHELRVPATGIAEIDRIGREFNALLDGERAAPTGESDAEFSPAEPPA